MSRTSRLTRTVLTVTAAGAAVLIGAGPAMAHHCFIPMYSLNGPKSANWFVVSAEEGAMELADGYTAPCDGGAEAGYAALRENKMPVGIKIKVSMTIGDPKDTGRMNPNGTNGKGLEYLGHEPGTGSMLPFEMVETWIAGAEEFCATD